MPLEYDAGVAYISVTFINRKEDTGPLKVVVIERPPPHYLDGDMTNLPEAPPCPLIQLKRNLQHRITFISSNVTLVGFLNRYHDFNDLIEILAQNAIKPHRGKVFSFPWNNTVQELDSIISLSKVIVYFSPFGVEFAENFQRSRGNFARLPNALYRNHIIISHNPFADQHLLCPGTFKPTYEDNVDSNEGNVIGMPFNICRVENAIRNNLYI